MMTLPTSARIGRTALAAAGVASLAGCFPYAGCGHMGMMTFGSSSYLRELVFVAALIMVIYLIFQTDRPSKPNPPPSAAPGSPSTPPGSSTQAPTNASAEPTTPAPDAPAEASSPLEVIKMRYARGEIDRETFETMKRDLGH